MSDPRQRNRDFLIEFIELYKSFPCLWEVKNPYYSNRNKKSLAYEELFLKYKEYDPAANKDLVTKKINSLRTVFKKELAKVKRSCVSGSGEEDVYKPSLWYFDLLYFLNDQDIPRTPVETIDDETDDTEKESTTSPVPVDDIGLQINEHEPPTTKTQERSRKRKCESIENRVLHMASDYFSRNQNDQFANIAHVWADKLRKLDKHQQLYAEKAINDILFEGELGNLTRDSVKTNLNTTPHIPKSYSAQNPSSHNSNTPSPNIIYKPLNVLSRDIKFQTPFISPQPSQKQHIPNPFVVQPTTYKFIPSCSQPPPHTSSEVTVTNFEPYTKDNDQQLSKKDLDLQTFFTAFK